MANMNSFKQVIDNVTPQIEVLQKAIELDPSNTIEYQRAIDFCETNISVSKSIIKAIKLVEKEAKKGDELKEETPKPTKKKTKKEEPQKVVEEPQPAVEETPEDMFDMFD
ncbi:hypothetical protein [Veillonella parvula]|jgi:hypothetical protein|uniref:hypothetical protein n=1 Tax=Veillonella parvula TaxID=29466 RepID=UPI0022E4F7B6|nr:hypothetical protein [Veillonella parvula]